MAGLCDSSVLTGQEGSISFKPPGTSVCLPDFSAWGTDGDTTHITIGGDADFRVNDPIIFVEEAGGNLDSSLTASTFALPFGISGALTALGGFVSSQAGTNGTVFNVPLTGGSGSGATANITVAGGEVSAVSIVSGGSGYQAGDLLGASLGGINISGFQVEVDAVSSNLRALTPYYVVAVGGAGSDSWVAVSATENGTAIAMTGDGGTGTEDSPAPAHINVQLADWYSVCGVREFSIEISRDELDITTLPCISDGGTGGGKLAAFKSTQAGYASASGSMTVYFTCNQENISNRLLGSSLLRSQSGARVKLYVCTVVNGGVVDDDASLFVEADINITGMSFSVNPDDPSSAELSFSVVNMVSAFGLTA